MTDSLHAPATLNGCDLHPRPVAAVAHAADYARFGSSHVEVVQEDDGQISCVCGINEDDGNTVACDACNRWQHIRCYYPQHADGELPEDLQHYCVECRPRIFDAQAAHARQRQARELRDALQNGVKRHASKSHKKKAKDVPNAAVANGWPLDKHRHDRNSASPRDQAPPAKRPKTSHRSSNSTANALSAQQSRKRSGSALHRRSVSRSPDSPVSSYSDEFIHAYQTDEYTIPDANCLSSLAVSSKLTSWLYEPSEVFRITNGMELQSIFQRWDGDISAIDTQADLVEIHEAHDPNITTPSGGHPTWKYATVKSALAPKACIGELRGHVGLKEDYQADPTNRWAVLRHPEPFVFYHPHLPICIDARQEGTTVRYVRRSCNPNAELKAIITGSADYHFCFIATRDIEAGEEVAIAWDGGRGLADMISARSSGAFSSKDIDSVFQWVSTVLSNCGPCACNRTDCMMARFDRRGVLPDYDDESHGKRAPKMAGKKKKPGQHITPLNTRAANSRSGSEARKVDLDDEPTDSRSASGSVGVELASRDITPNTHYSANGSLSTVPEVSERERKKLAKEEEMFRRQEEEAATGRQAKKKRSSGGSTFNPTNVAAPTSSSSKQPSIPASSKYADASTSKQSGLPSARSASGKRPKTAAMPKVSKPATRIARPPKPTYADAQIQCDMDKEEAAWRAATPKLRRPFVSLTQRLLERCARNNAMQMQNGVRPADFPDDGEKMEIDQPDTHPSLGTNGTSTRMHAEQLDHVFTPIPTKYEDVEMADAEPSGSDAWAKDPQADLQPGAIQPGAIQPGATGDSQPVFSSPVPASNHPQMYPPAAPGADMPKTASSEEAMPSPPSSKPDNLHLDMPPRAANPFATSALLLTGGTPNSVLGSVVHSPSALAGSAALFSPSVQASVTPSTPARKKLSLSDYTRRSKAKETEPRPERESSPTSTASGPVAGSSLLPSADSRTKDGLLPAVREDEKMEEATAHPASAP